jgi:thiol:disulfide interchange protein DsbD
MKQLVVVWTLALAALVGSGAAQDFEPEAVFSVKLVPDREPVVAGEDLRLAVVLKVDEGWHVNSDQPGDEFSLPTELRFELPAGWLDPVLSFPEGTRLEFDFADAPIEVWEGEAVIVASVTVPAAAAGDHRLRVTVTAQACNTTQCLPPTEVSAGVGLEVAPAGTPSGPVNRELFEQLTGGATGEGAAPEASDLASRSLPLLLLGVFFAGLALNLTPCVFPLIPITLGYFSRQSAGRAGSTFPLALAYVVGIALTYSALGVVAAMSGSIFGSALQSPWVVGLIVAVLLALASSMFGLWELGVPQWAQRASGGRTGVLGALIMGLMMGFVAAPCIGPFVVGLLTFVGQRGDPVLGFLLFFTLALGLGLPYLILGTFTGAVNRLPASGMWMVGVRRVFGVVLVAMAAYFAAPLMPGSVGGWLMPAVLVVGALYLLVVDRTGHEQPVIDRVMRLLTAAMLVAGVITAPLPGGVREAAAGVSDHLEWRSYDEPEVAKALAGQAPVIVDFYADWCAPCKELDEKTFAAPEVRALLEPFARFKVDLTRATDDNQALTERFGVLGVPTVIVFVGGVEAFRITGFEPPARFLERLQAGGPGGQD